MVNYEKCFGSFQYSWKYVKSETYVTESLDS